MARIEAVTNEDELDVAKARIEELFRRCPNLPNGEPGDPEYDELNAIADLVIAYEDIHYPIPDPTPAGAIEFWLDHWNLTPDALAPCLGNREVVDKVLAGQREVTPGMAQAIYECLNIDVRDLVDKAATPTAND